MQAATIDLDAYLRRIDYRDKVFADLSTLKALVTHHTRCIPFENLNPFLGWPVETDLPTVERKLVREGRGGYCYEQNGLFRAVLEAVGIPVTGLAARPLWQVPENHQPAQSHMTLRAEIGGGAWLVDVGFGGQTPTAPLRLDTDKEQLTPHGLYRLRRQEGDYLLQARIGDNWLPVYRFDLQKQSAGDYKVFNWYCSTHPESRFVRDLIAARAFVGGRHTLLNRELSYYPLRGPKTLIKLGSPKEVRETLADVFGIHLPGPPALDTALAGLFSAGQKRA